MTNNRKNTEIDFPLQTCACSSSSKSKTPAPSPITKPSRFFSYRKLHLKLELEKKKKRLNSKQKVTYENSDVGVTEDAIQYPKGLKLWSVLYSFVIEPRMP